MRLLKLLLVLLACAVAVPAVAGPFEESVAAYDRGDYATALRLLRPLAAAGDADAQNNLGTMYHTGKGVPQNYATAVSWFRRAADQGVAVAQDNLGDMYSRGLGVPQDYAEAIKWYRKGADQGYARAQGNLGLMYANGRGVPQDYGGAARAGPRDGWKLRACRRIPIPATLTRAVTPSERTAPAAARPTPPRTANGSASRSKHVTQMTDDSRWDARE
ncbi:Sel1 repeat-containing protein [Rhodospirillales bacterium URHD0017]|nr:Sel1 repeat-containing protein [Rhodospirillales bacterium URHD0017]